MPKSAQRRKGIKPPRHDDPLRLARLGWYKSTLRFASERNATYPGGMEAFFVIAAVAIAEFNGHPVNISSIAAMLNRPRTTVHRNLMKLKRAGFVSVRREGKFAMVRATQKMEDLTIPLVNEHLSRMLPWACEEAHKQGLCAPIRNGHTDPNGQ